MSGITSESEIETIVTESYNDYSDVLKNYNVIKHNNKSSPVITIYEKTKIIGLRSQQLSLGCKPLIKVDPHIDNVIEIAEEEFKQKKIPFLIRRKIGNSYEYWKLEDLDDYY